MLHIFMGDTIINASLYTFALRGNDEESDVMAYTPDGADDATLVLFTGALDECRHFMMELAKELSAKTWTGSSLEHV